MATDVEAARERIAASMLRHRAARADRVGQPDSGRELRDRAVPRAPDRSYLKAVLLIELAAGSRRATCSTS